MNNKIITAGLIAAALVVGQVAGRLIDQPLGASVAPPAAATLNVPTAAELSSRFSEVSDAVDRAVVNINTETLVRHRFRLPRRGGGGGQQFQDPFDFFNRFFGGELPPSRSQKRESLGSGFVVDPKGYILTNYHVVNGADEIRVELTSGEEFPAKVVGGDSFTVTWCVPAPSSALDEADSNVTVAGVSSSWIDTSAVLPPKTTPLSDVDSRIDKVSVPSLPLIHI